MVGDDALVLPFAGKLHAAQPQDGGVLHHLAALGPQVGVILHLGIMEKFIVFFQAKVIGESLLLAAEQMKLKLEPFIADCVSGCTVICGLGKSSVREEIKQL